jgi:CRP-like cAMP-binding protein
MRVLVIGPQDFGSFVELRGVARALAEQLARRLRAADEDLHDAVAGALAKEA